MIEKLTQIHINRGYESLQKHIKHRNHFHPNIRVQARQINGFWACVLHDSDQFASSTWQSSHLLPSTNNTHGPICGIKYFTRERWQMYRKYTKRPPAWDTWRNKTSWMRHVTVVCKSFVLFQENIIAVIFLSSGNTLHYIIEQKSEYI